MWTRLLPLALAAAAAFAAGLAVGAGGGDPRRAAAQSFVAAWARGDYAEMRSLLTAEDQREISQRRFSNAYRNAAKVATLSGIDAGRATGPGANGAVVVPVTMRTRIFGTLSGSMALPVVEEEDGAAIDWSPQLVHPGLRPGEKLTRKTRMPPRAAIQARDGTPLAEGEARLSELGALASEIAGRLGPAPPERAAELERRGVPPDATVGLTGLEREFDPELAGRPGGELSAGDRVLAEVEPERGHAVRTTIDPDVERAAVEALAGRYGGVAVMRPRDGEVLALAGIAYSAPQPPGSMFKIITLAGALDEGVAKPSSKYPVQTAAVLEGVELQNAHGESCGGTLRDSFAHSCNSVFAPMGAELGAEGLVATAERFGFNADPPAWPARCARRSRRPARSATTSRSARPRSARARCSPPAADGGGRRGDRRRTGVRVRPTLRKGAPPERTARGAARVAKHDRPLHARGRHVRAPASAPRSRASGSPARPAPPSCATRPTTTRPRRSERRRPPTT